MKIKSNQKASIALALMLSMSCVAPTVVPSFAAAGTEKGTITINSDQEVKYKGFKIFSGKVKPVEGDGGGASANISNLEWASQEIEDAVVAVINNEIGESGTKFAKDATGHYNAQAVATYLSTKITGTDQNTIVANDNLANKIAKAIKGLTKTTEVTPKETKNDLDPGYWLFVTDPDTIATGHKNATAPIFTVLGGGDVTINEKTSLPTIDKKVKGANGQWMLSRDSQVGQIVDYKLTGTVSKNIATYDKYSYSFEDQLPAGMDLVEDSVKVSIGGVDVTNKFTKEYTNRLLKLSIENLKAIDGVNADTNVLVEYKAKLNNDAVIGGTGNENTVKVVYSNDPYTNSKGESKPVTAKDYAFKLKLVKVDKDTNKPLKDAKFTIKVKNPANTETNGKYVQADGTLADTEYKFTSSAEGIVAVSGLEAGTYTITETDAPESYKVAEPVDFTISATYDDLNMTALNNTVSGDNVIAGLDTTDDRTMNAFDGTASDLTSGEVRVTLGDIKETDMPLTGQGGIMAGMALGGGIFLVSAAMYVRNKKQENC
jgi:fimbrial isopeptide formation D2 family protein